MPNLLNSLRRPRALCVALLATLGAAQGCTDLDEVPQDALTPENAFKTDAEVVAGLASVYAQLRGGTTGGYYNLSEITSDEQLVPTRGNDWFDNGKWLEMYRQTWTASSSSTLDDINGLWNDMFAGVAKANLMISIVDGGNSATKAATLAELRVLRAWYYYVLMDMFGGVPLVTTTEVTPTAKASRDSVYKFLVSELTAVRTDLPEKGQVDYGRVTRGAADAMLANLYLNAPVFQGTVSAGGLAPAAPRYAEAIAAADRVINSGLYTLAVDYNSNFSTNNEGSPENIFVVANSSVPGLGENFPMRVLHYNQLGVGGGPWNGFAGVAETYRAFDPADVRRTVWLAGPQRSFDTGRLVNDRAGAPLVFTDTIGDITKAAENEGPRLLKFPPLTTAPDGNSFPNDYPMFRLAEMYMIKAEALNEQGQTGAAIAILNQLRARAFNPAKPLSTGLTQAQARTAILSERLFEFAGEGKRRQDLIRMGEAKGTPLYTAARRFKLQTAPYRVLLAIPSTQIANNPQLVQNPGY